MISEKSDLGTHSAAIVKTKMSLFRTKEKISILRNPYLDIKRKGGK